jgi:hypothetical protein
MFSSFNRPLNPVTDDATVASGGRHNLRTFLFRARADDRRGGDGAEIMARRDLADRVEVLEQKVTALEELPARLSSLETQIVQLRTEMKGEFSAVRHEMRSLEENLRGEMRALNDQTLTQMRVWHEDVVDRLTKLGEGGRGSRKRGR